LLFCWRSQESAADDKREAAASGHNAEEEKGKPTEEIEGITGT